MVKRTNKTPSPKSRMRKQHRKPANRRSKDADSASIDALFDDFARNLARKIVRANTQAPARKNGQ